MASAIILQSSFENLMANAQNYSNAMHQMHSDQLQNSQLDRQEDCDDPIMGAVDEAQ
jgi:hypothetical protein